MNERFNVHILVTTSTKLATIMSVLDGEAKLIKVEQIEEKVKRKSPITRHKLNGETGSSILLDLAKGGKELTSDHAEEIFKTKGFAASSAKARISDLVTSGKLELVRKGVYKITPKAAK
jgi:hypothetical protein